MEMRCLCGDSLELAKKYFVINGEDSSVLPENQNSYNVQCINCKRSYKIQVSLRPETLSP